MNRRFELSIALRYLTARRRQTVISIITVISVLGVAAGVMALIIALAINTGFRQELQRNLLGATAHVVILEKQPGPGIANWRQLSRQLAQLPHVKQAAPALYGSVMFTGPVQAAGGTLKGIPDTGPMPDVLKKLKNGRVFRGWAPERGFPPIILGSRIAANIGMTEGAVVRVLSPQGEMTPFGPKLVEHRFRVTAIFESGFFDLDNMWAFTSLKDCQRVLAVGDVANAIELTLDDVYLAPQVAQQAEKSLGGQLAATHWMEQNKQLLSALKMERVVTVITIGLIQMVAALNILISLIMMVIEKHRDIAVLLSMGVRRAQIARIFMFQGLVIGGVGAVLGLIAGYSLSYLGNRYQWIHLDEAVYSLSYVPFAPRLVDGIWISGIAMLISFLATLYPARSATRIQPAVALRYE
ncbi:MAG: ABC transporter permease [Bryobacterales bacterium]|nr:ABC transporter permease [Bryobacterales bacterium]